MKESYRKRVQLPEGKPHSPVSIQAVKGDGEYEEDWQKELRKAIDPDNLGLLLDHNLYTSDGEAESGMRQVTASGNVVLE